MLCRLVGMHWLDAVAMPMQQLGDICPEQICSHCTIVSCSIQHPPICLSLKRVSVQSCCVWHGGDVIIDLFGICEGYNRLTCRVIVNETHMSWYLVKWWTPQWKWMRVYSNYQFLCLWLTHAQRHGAWRALASAWISCWSSASFSLTESSMQKKKKKCAMKCCFFVLLLITQYTLACHQFIKHPKK